MPEQPSSFSSFHSSSRIFFFFGSLGLERSPRIGGGREKKEV